MAEKLAQDRYDQFDTHRREAERLAADAEDVRALEEAAKKLGERKKGSSR